MKTEKNARKKAIKARKDQSDDEEDIELMIAKFKKMDEEKVAISEEPSNNPSPRLHGSLIVNPLKETEVILFGGEFYNGDSIYLYNDLYK